MHSYDVFKKKERLRFNLSKRGDKIGVKKNGKRNNNNKEDKF